MESIYEKVLLEEDNKSERDLATSDNYDSNRFKSLNSLGRNQPSLKCKMKFREVKKPTFEIEEVEELN